MDDDDDDDESFSRSVLFPVQSQTACSTPDTASALRLSLTQH